MVSVGLHSMDFFFQKNSMDFLFFFSKEMLGKSSCGASLTFIGLNSTPGSQGIDVFSTFEWHQTMNIQDPILQAESCYFPLSQSGLACPREGRFCYSQGQAGQLRLLSESAGFLHLEKHPLSLQQVNGSVNNVDQC